MYINVGTSCFSDYFINYFKQLKENKASYLAKFLLFLFLVKAFRFNTSAKQFLSLSSPDMVGWLAGW